MVRRTLRRKNGSGMGNIVENNFLCGSSDSCSNLSYCQTPQQTYSTALTAMLTQVNFLLNLTRDSPPLQDILTLEKVKEVKVGRRRREGWLVMILREVLLFKLRVEKIARRSWGTNRMAIAWRESKMLL